MKRAKLCIALFVFFTIFISCTADQFEEDTELYQNEKILDSGNGDEVQDDVKPTP